jgi:hypothetical protein
MGTKLNESGGVGYSKTEGIWIIRKEIDNKEIN